MRVAKTAHETEENKMKRISKTIALTLSLMLLVMNFTACSAGGKAGKLIKAYTGGSSYYIEEIGWYGSEVYTLKVNDNDTYELIYQKHMFGTTDPGIKGLRTVIYTGKCTSAEAADGWETHRDYTLQPAEHIYFEQHEKGFGRSTIAGHCVIDTDNWTDEMTQVVDPEMPPWMPRPSSKPMRRPLRSQLKIPHLILRMSRLAAGSWSCLN
jgi:hypothetical protein